MFIFLSRHGPQIYQTILKQCSVKRRSSVQPLSDNKRSFVDQSPAYLPTTTDLPAGPPVHNPADASADTEEDHYSTINDTSSLKWLSLVKPYLSNSMEAVGEEGEDEDEVCHSLEAVNLDDVTKDNIYYNLRKATPPVIRKELVEPETDNSECIYADVKIVDSPLNPQLQPSSSPLPQPLPRCTLPQSVPFVLPKPRHQRQPPVNNYIQPGYNVPAQAVDDMKEMEEAISSSACAPPTEAPGSFKHRLAEIISKDLAKFQPPLPSGQGSPTFSQ